MCLSSFYSRLESSLTSEFFHEVEEFERVFKQLQRKHQDDLKSGTSFGTDSLTGGTHDLAMTLVGWDYLEVDGSTCLGGSVAGLLEKVASRRQLVWGLFSRVHYY